MKVWIFVEGRSDVRALEALWAGGGGNFENKAGAFS